MADGRVSEAGAGKGFRSDGAEALSYDNPLSQTVERAWYDGKIVFALVGEPMQLGDAHGIKVAKEYQPVHAVDLDQDGWMTSHKPVHGQLNVYGSIPGQHEYSAIWKFYYVMVPDGYEANTLRSEQDCLDSGYQIKESNYYRN